MVWFGFAAFATAAQVAIMSLMVWPGAAAVAVPASAVLFVAAGLYQFSELKQACLRVCQQPFSFFFMNWTDKPEGVLRRYADLGRMNAYYEAKISLRDGLRRVLADVESRSAATIK